MKNKYFERRREAAKRYKKTLNRSDEIAGVSIIHDYSHPKKLSYWDDFSFVLGSQRIIVTWIHPRMAFSDEVERQADVNVLEAIGPGPEWDLFGNDAKIYKRVGKSRKKVQFYQGNPIPIDYKAYRDKVRAERQRLLRESSFVAKPSMRIEQWATGRNVSITYPVELRNETDIIVFAAKLKQHLLGRGDMFAHLGDYTYSAADWQAEQETE